MYMYVCMYVCMYTKKSRCFQTVKPPTELLLNPRFEASTGGPSTVLQQGLQLSSHHGGSCQNLSWVSWEIS